MYYSLVSESKAHSHSLYRVYTVSSLLVILHSVCFTRVGPVWQPLQTVALTCAFVLSLTSCLSIESKHEVTILGGLNEFVVKFYGPQGSKYMCGYVFFLSSLLDSEVSFSTRTSMWRNPGHSCTHSHRFWVLSRWPQSCSLGSACSVLK